MTIETVRWGILGAADIVQRSFAPAMNRTDDGKLYSVAARDGARAATFAGEQGIEHSTQGYESVLEDDSVDAVYIPLPNSLHADWTIAALRAGKPVLCEKPMCVSLEQTHQVLAVARETGVALWEAFVFPFHRQMTRVKEIIASGAIGEPTEVHATFHFAIDDRHDIRLSADLAGGALNDVGCYCVALGQFILSGDPLAGSASARWEPENVDGAMAGVLEYPEGRRLVMSCAMDLPHNTFSRILGTQGEIRLTNPYHPEAHDTFALHQDSRVEQYSAEQGEPSFAPALRHINQVVRSLELPRHLALDDAAGIALGVELLRRSARSGRRETP